MSSQAPPPPPPPPLPPLPGPPAGLAPAAPTTARSLATAAVALSLVGVLEAAWILLLGFTAASQCAAADAVAPGLYLVPAGVLLAMPVVSFLVRRSRSGPPLAVAILVLAAVLGLDFLGAGWSFVAIFWTDPC